MTPALKNRIGMSVSGTPGVGTITLGSAILDAANGDYVGAAAVWSENAYADWLYVDGNNWSIEREVLYNSAAGTLTRGTVESTWNGSALSTSTLSLSNAAKAYVVASAHRLSGPIHEGRAALSGYGLEWLAATGSIIRAKPGYCVINGQVYSDTSYITTITGDTTLVADALYNVYLYNDAGTRKLEIDRRTAATDDPVFDAELDYHKAPNTTQFTSHASGVGRDGFRWVGVFYTYNNSGTAECESFICSGNGREKTFSHRFKSTAMHRFVSGTTSASTWTSVDISATVPVPATHIALSAYANASSAGEMIVGVSTIQVSGSVTTEGNYLSRGYATNSGYSMGVPTFVPIDSRTVYWNTFVSGGTMAGAYIQHLGSVCRL